MAVSEGPVTHYTPRFCSAACRSEAAERARRNDVGVPAAVTASPMTSLGAAHRRRDGDHTLPALQSIRARRNAYAHHPDILAVQRRECARNRSEPEERGGRARAAA